ncbi:hypothetical protein BVC80_7969g2 [Macleaya cordata]|uniref:Uncharacterized protein n=1 Tax=Macleaya cordata TaxID=56857 RepID=A0A200QI45_MACCD|nr:hypothetical protein BVC80_7969g2 [Macleaya cordata]
MSLWQGVLKSLPDFKKGSRIQVGKGNQTRFWEGVWIGEEPFSERFSSLYQITRNKQLSVNQSRTTNQDKNEWNLGIERRLYDHEIDDLIELLGILDGVVLTEDDDRIWWLGDKKGRQIENWITHTHAS